MKKKSWFYLMMTLFLLPIMFIVNGCTLGVCTLTFEAWGGTHPRDITMSPGEELDANQFTDASKLGYNFLYWCYDSDLTNEIHFPMFASHGTYTYYAKYEIDYDYFNNNNQIISWNNSSQETITFDSNISSGYSQRCYLLDKTNIKYQFKKITLEPIDATPGQEVLFNGFEVYDENGKTVKDVNPDVNIFEPEATYDIATTFTYVLRLTTDARGGDFKITVS